MLQDEAEVAEVEMLLEAYQTHLDTTYNKLLVRIHVIVPEPINQVQQASQTHVGKGYRYEHGCPAGCNLVLH